MGFALEKLTQVERSAIARSLFVVTKEYGAKLHGRCPVHGDKDSPSFVYHTEGDWCKCQGCGFGGDLVKLWCQVKGLDSKGEGFKEFCREYGIASAVGSRQSAVKGRRPRPMVRQEAKAEVKGVWKKASTI